MQQFEENPRILRVVHYLKSFHHPNILTIPDTLPHLQALVGGYLERLHLGGSLVAISNVEAKLTGTAMDANRAVQFDDHREIIFGPFFVCRIDGNYRSIEPDDEARLLGWAPFTCLDAKTRIREASNGLVKSYAEV